MTHVVVPTTPGVLSALGGLIADVKSDFISTVFLDLDESVISVIQSGYAALEEQAVRWLREEQGYDGTHRWVYSADMRYRGQSYEIEAELNADDVNNGNVNGIAESFHREHEQVYEHADRDAAVQVINLRLVIIGASPKPQFPESELVDTAAEPARHIEVFMNGERRAVPLYARTAMKPGQHFAGPAVIAQSDCTTCVPGGLAGRVDAYGNLILTLACAEH